MWHGQSGHRELEGRGQGRPNPTPPSIDIYPSPRSTESSATGRGTSTGSPSGHRVTTADNEGGQDAVGDDGRRRAESVEAAIRSTKTYDGAQLGDIEGPTEFGVFIDADGERVSTRLYSGALH